MRDCSVIIVSWNARAYLRKCLESIERYTTGIAYEIIVVDNASSDGSAAMVRADFPHVRLLVNVRNLGFARANNQGAEIAEGEWLCFLNDDIALTENALAPMMTMMKKNKRIGLLGCRLVFPDGSPQESVRRFPTLRDQLFILLKLHHLIPRNQAFQQYYARDTDYTTEQEVDQVMGACMMIAASDFEKLHGFDDHFFVWFEEVDLQKRMKETLGKKNVYTPQTSMIHAQSVSFQQLRSVTNQRRFNQSMHWYFQKHHGRRAAMIITIVHPWSMFCAAIITFFRLWQRPIHRSRS